MTTLTLTATFLSRLHAIARPAPPTVPGLDPGARLTAAALARAKAGWEEAMSAGVGRRQSLIDDLRTHCRRILDADAEAAAWLR